jgi:hypothetical protein
MWFFKKNTINYDHLISVLETGTNAELQQLLWQPKQGQVAYLSVTTEMLQKLRHNSSVEAKISIFQTIDRGNYQLIIFHLPVKDELPYSPLILHKVTGKVVGVMLPFNELHGYLSKRSSSAIGYLGALWVKFTLDHRFKKQQ